MNSHTFAARAAALVVACVAGAASWAHIASVAIGAGERPWVGYSLPLAIDGLILVGVAALLEDRRNDRRRRLSARGAIFVGVAATLAANMASAEPGVRPALVAVVAPVAFLISVEVLTGSRKTAAPATVQPDPAPEGEPETKPAEPLERPQRPRRGKQTTAAKVARLVTRSPELTKAQVAAKLGISERTVQRQWPVTVGASPNGSKSQDPSEGD